MASSPPQAQRCPRCGSPLAPGARFCYVCGLDLTATHQSLSQQASSPPAQPGNQGGAAAQAGSQPAVGTLVDAPARRKSGYRFTVISLLIIILLLAAAGLLVYLLSLSRFAATPIITISSQYHVGATLAAANGTTLQASGKGFSANAAVTFLLDGNPIPGAQSLQSDKNGSVQTSWTITSEWSLGNHIISAKDATGHATTGVTIAIVAPGEAMTPGPNGAPFDSQSFTFTATVKPVDAVSGMALPSFTDALAVTGRPDPAGGTVCDPKNDTGQPVIESGATSGTGYTLTYIATCSGAYKGGMLTYTETATSYQIKFVNGVICKANVPFVNQSLTGSFTSATTISGAYSADALTFTCNNDTSFQNSPQKGAWTGTLTG